MEPRGAYLLLELAVGMATYDDDVFGLILHSLDAARHILFATLWQLPRRGPL